MAKDLNRVQLETRSANLPKLLGGKDLTRNLQVSNWRRFILGIHVLHPIALLSKPPCTRLIWINLDLMMCVLGANARRRSAQERGSLNDLAFSIDFLVVG